MIRNGLERLIGLGTQPQKDPKRNHIIRLINNICLFVILLITPHMVLTLYFRSILATLVQLAAILALALTLYLNSRHHFNLVRIISLLVGNFHIFNMVLILGIDSGVYFYYSAAIIAPLFFYTSKEFKYILFFMPLTIVLAVLVQFLLPDFDPIVHAPKALLTFFFYFSVIGSLIIVFVFVLHFYHESNRFEESLKEANQKLIKLSETDPLTQLPNRRSFKATLDREWGKGIRSKNPLSVIMMDVDYFKMFNDCYGHQEGDRCLARIAGIIPPSTREFVDFPARYGGEEFIVLLSNTNMDDAYAVAERIRKEILILAIPHQLNEHDRLVTCSFGVACCVPNDNAQPNDLIHIADQTLYKAKENGRNRVEIGS